MAKKTAMGTFGRGKRRISPLGWALRGAAAGAAGTTALDAVTYLDMAIRGRPASSSPERTVEKLAEKAHLAVPGDGQTRQNRLQGLGALTGYAAGVGIGVLVGLVRAAGFRSSPLVGTAVITGGVLVATNSPMTVLGVTDPRTWSTADWISDVVPHLAYAAVVKAMMDAFDRP
ncbi:MAG TPA: hypothetical protein VGD12_01965 [Blastococcus sp.]|jgi:hypothetical protein